MARWVRSASATAGAWSTRWLSASRRRSRQASRSTAASPSAEDVPKIEAPLLIHYAGLDTRVNQGWPAFEKALKASDKKYEVFIYPDVNHGFHNDTTPRYDKKAAELAWTRTIEFFKKHLS